MPDQPHLFELEKIGTPTLGYISVVEQDTPFPFQVERVYWTYFTPNHVQRGGHAHKALRQLVFAVSGIIEFHLDNGRGEKTYFKLEEPQVGLYIPAGYWRDIRFSHSAVLLCLASQPYEETDYIRDYEKFLTWAK